MTLYSPSYFLVGAMIPPAIFHHYVLAIILLAAAVWWGIFVTEMKLNDRQ